MDGVRRVSICKKQKQEEMLQQRAESKVGLVCASTRNVGRLGPKGGSHMTKLDAINKAHIKDRKCTAHIDGQGGTRVGPC